MNASIDDRVRELMEVLAMQPRYLHAGIIATALREIVRDDREACAVAVEDSEDVVGRFYAARVIRERPAP